jgi:uncharacterized protein YggU (UPF0235/DUF167 family)
VTASGTEPWRRAEGCVIVRVRVTPKASLDAIDGLMPTPEGPALKARVRGVPADGAANDAVGRLLAEWLGVPKTSVSVAAGAKSRLKSLRVVGEPQGLEVRLRARIERLGR